MPGNGVDDGESEEKDVEVSFRGGKRTTHEDCHSPSDQESRLHPSHPEHVACREELCLRRFLRLCFFPVFWMHEYKRVVLFLNVPQRFRESETELHHRMREMVLKYGRLNLQSCSFHTSVHELIWSVEAGRKKRVGTRHTFVDCLIARVPACYRCIAEGIGFLGVHLRSHPINSLGLSTRQSSPSANLRMM